ncbi:MAG: ubiquinol-cytochrome c reductase iron-sulfur subunit [Pirellulales bacterium]
MQHVVDSPLAEPKSSERRSFLASAAAIVVGGIVAIFPFAAGLGVLFDPLRRRAKGAADATGDEAIKYVRIGPLDVLPADGNPHQFALTDDVVDAWTRAPAQRVGTAFLIRTDADDGPQIAAFSSVCPHLGCAVDYNRPAGEFECPCHASAFAKDGAKLFGPSLRGLDPLAVKLVENGDQKEIWVERARFRTGIAERILVG